MDNGGFTLNNHVYNALKFVALVLLPAFGTLYFGLGQIWNFPAVEQVIGTITVLDTFLGLLLSKSSSNYAKSPYNLVGTPPVGKIVVMQDHEGAAEGMRMEAYIDPFVVPAGGQVIFDVAREQKL